MSERNGHHRDGRGRFLPGNPGGPGNPHLRRARRLKDALYAAVDDSDIEAIVQSMVASAKSGDVTAAREVLDRTIGKPSQTDVLARLEALEELLTQEIRNEH